jgi:hypothetical protein
MEIKKKVNEIILNGLLIMKVKKWIYGVGKQVSIWWNQRKKMLEEGKSWPKW